jgi:hypothetical protein
LKEEFRLRVLGNMVLSKIYESMRGGATGVCMILHNEELNDLYFALTIFRVIKSKRMRLVGMKLVWMRGKAFIDFGGKPE